MGPKNMPTKEIAIALIGMLGVNQTEIIKARQIQVLQMV